MIPLTDNEKFDLILTKLEKIDKLEADMQSMKNDIQDIKYEIQGMKDEIQGMKDDIQGMKNDIQELNHRMTSLELHIENSTDKNIQLLAENFVELTKKLNQAIPVADKNLAYEIKVKSHNNYIYPLLFFKV